MESQTFVLVHGAWHGGWCWKQVAEMLRKLGHVVTTPTLTGLGERAHLAGPAVRLETHINDIINHIEYEDLEEVVLVGHSYAGVVISHVADRISSRLRKLVYLDAQIARNNSSIMGALAPEIRETRRAASTDNGLSMLAPGADVFGIKDTETAAWVARRLTPHPMATYEDVGHLQDPDLTRVPSEFVVCTQPAFPSIAVFLARARDMGWPVHELASGHDAMLISPDLTADLLRGLADG